MPDFRVLVLGAGDTFLGRHRVFARLFELMKLGSKELKANRVSKAASLPSVNPSICSDIWLTADNSKTSSFPNVPGALMYQSLY